MTAYVWVDGGWGVHLLMCGRPGKTGLWVEGQGFCLERVKYKMSIKLAGDNVEEAFVYPPLQGKCREETRAENRNVTQHIGALKTTRRKEIFHRDNVGGEEEGYRADPWGMPVFSHQTEAALPRGLRKNSCWDQRKFLGTDSVLRWRVANSKVNVMLHFVNVIGVLFLPHREESRAKGDPFFTTSLLPLPPALFGRSQAWNAIEKIRGSYHLPSC